MKSKIFKSEVMNTDVKGIVTIAISRFDVVDGGGDVTRKGAFSKTFQEGSNRIKHVIDHKLQQASVVGLPMKMYETTDYAVVESALNLEKEISRDLFSDYKFFKDHGKTLEHSYAYKTIKGKDRLNEDKKYIGEEILELKMFEYSTVAMGMNSDTPLLSMKSAEDLKALETYLRKYDVSNKHAKEIENIIALMKAVQEPESTPVTNESHYALNLRLQKSNESEMFNLNLKTK